MTGQWAVVFTDPPPADNALWWWRIVRRFLRPGFRHCFAVGQWEGAAVTVEWTFTGLHVEAIEPGEVDEWLRRGVREWGWTVLSVERAEVPAVRVRPVLSCAQAVGALLGIPAAALRPSALHRQLVASGAVPISEA